MKTCPHQPRLPNRWLSRATLAMSLALLTLVGSWGSPEAFAQDVDLPGLQLERFRPAPGPADYLNVFGTNVPAHLQWDAAFYLSFADDPMQVATRDFPFKETVDMQTTFSLLGSIGLYDDFEIGLMVPITVAQSSQELQPILPPGSDSSTDLPVMGINDWRLSGKYQLLDMLEDPLGVAFIAALYAPLATHNSLTSDEGIGAEVRASGEYVIWRGIRAAANLGYRYRSMREVLRDSKLGDELLWGVAVGIPLFHKELDAIVEIDGAISVARDKGPSALARGEVPAEMKLAGRYALDEEWTLTAGVGSGLGDGIGAPDIRAFLGIGAHWVTGGGFAIDYRDPDFEGEGEECPEFYYMTETGDCELLDTDGDGVPDVIDKCPDTPPDTPVLPNGCADDYLDAPEPERVSPCPDKPDDYDGFVDEDGCPADPDESVSITRNKITIADQIHFETAKATIRRESHGILDEVAEVLIDNPQIEKVRVEGHTDSRGSEVYNQKLSQERSESVRRYLIEQGVEADRLTAVGFGETTPIADNETEEGRQKNRRVDFTILKTAPNLLEK
jgi:outer membrane protein OmpA-like peptidoglycan-associated protein